MGRPVADLERTLAQAPDPADWIQSVLAVAERRDVAAA
jgi:hypothetical protein